MSRIRRPIAATIFCGLLCSLTLMLLNLGWDNLIYRPFAFRILLWSYLAVYGILLTRWSKTQLQCIVYPLIVLFCVIFSGSSHSAFFFIAIATLSWIRSGICFQKPFPGVLIGELILGFGGGALVNFFTPHSTITWAMGLWVFFLVQALYFVVFGEIDAAEEKRKATQDPFEEIRRRAEKVLSTGLP